MFTKHIYDQDVTLNLIKLIFNQKTILFLFKKSDIQRLNLSWQSKK
jgi:hypothetical protein